MPAPTSVEDSCTKDEVKVFRDEVGEPSEGPACDRSSNQRDIREEKLRLVDEREDRGRDDRKRHLDRFHSLHPDNYRHHGYNPFGSNYFGLPSSSQYGYPMVSPFPGFPTVPSPMGAMQIPGSKLAPSPLANSPIPSPFLQAANGTPPPAHSGFGGRPGLYSPFGTSPHYPIPMMGMTGADMANQLAALSSLGHNQVMDLMSRNASFMTPNYRSASPYPSMAPHSPFGPLMLGSPGLFHGGFGSPHFIPPSPDASGRFSSHGQVSSSRRSHGDSSASSTSSNRDHSERRHGRESKKDKANHVKKPLNAFMLYMKEQRATVQAECTLKESAAINQILGKKWHALDRAEQTKYYEMAKQERENHAKIYPGWSAKDNYAVCGKKKRRKKEKSDEPKKCRAIYGIDRQAEWCKPCRRKKKCIRHAQNGMFSPNGESHVREPKSSSESVSAVSSSMQVLSPLADSIASTDSPASDHSTG